MSFLRTFANSFDPSRLLMLVIQAAVALLCIIIHECAHGFAADRMGAHTARRLRPAFLEPAAAYRSVWPDYDDSGRSRLGQTGAGESGQFPPSQAGRWLSRRWQVRPPISCWPMRR